MAEQSNSHVHGEARVIDRNVLQGLKELGGGDPGFLVELIDIYLDDSLRRVRVLTAAIEEGDIANVERSAHTLKSSSANIGALFLAEACQQVETRARARTPLGDVASVARELARLHQSAVDDLRRIRDGVQP